jgi:hypothetical protein
LPAEISNAVEKCIAYDATAARSCANVVCLANAFAKQQGLYAGNVDSAESDRLVAEGKQLLGFSDEALALLRAGLYKRVGTLFDLKVGSKTTS